MAVCLTRKATMLGVAMLLSIVSATEPIELWLLPHSHADVGWLQTVNSLERINVSRILDGVTAELSANHPSLVISVGSGGVYL